MTVSLTIHLLPDLFTPADLAGGTAVVIDILRASTTICHALDAGAKQVIPCLTVEEAHAQAKAIGGDVLFGGERGGVAIDGFDLSNTPMEYTPDVVDSKTIIFTTTNGTKALHRCLEADRVLIGAFVNLGAVVACLSAEDRPIHLVCAGTNGTISGEDVLFAGAVVAGLLEKRENLVLVNDSARLALDFWRSNSQNDAQFRQAMLDSQGGRNLQQLGLTADIERSGERDLFDILPEWDKENNSITRSE